MAWKADHPLTIKEELRPLEKIDVLNEKGLTSFPLSFFVHGFHDEDRIEEHVANKEDTVEKWREWIKEKRVFVRLNQPVVKKDDFNDF